jgi:uncharacterized membrane protein
MFITKVLTKLLTLTEFLKDGNQKLSSKRIAFIFSLPLVFFGTLYFGNMLIKNNFADQFVIIWCSFLLYSALIGGFIAIEPIRKITNKITKKNENN